MRGIMVENGMESQMALRQLESYKRATALNQKELGLKPNEVVISLWAFYSADAEEEMESYLRGKFVRAKILERRLDEEKLVVGIRPKPLPVSERILEEMDLPELISVMALDAMLGLNRWMYGFLSETEEPVETIEVIEKLPGMRGIGAYSFYVTLVRLDREAERVWNKE